MRFLILSSTLDFREPFEPLVSLVGCFDGLDRWLLVAEDLRLRSDSMFEIYCQQDTSLLQMDKFSEVSGGETSCSELTARKEEEVRVLDK